MDGDAGGTCYAWDRRRVSDKFCLLYLVCMYIIEELPSRYAARGLRRIKQSSSTKNKKGSRKDVCTLIIHAFLS